MTAPFKNVIVIPAVFIAASCLLFDTTANGQQLSLSQRTKIKQVKTFVDDGGKLFKKKEFESSAKSIKSAQSLLVELAETGNPEMIEKLKNDYDRIIKAQKLLKTKGQEFDAMKELDSYIKEAEPDSESSGTEDSESDGSSTKSDSGDKELVSFTKQVAPIIIEHCGSCHIDSAKGRYSAETYESLKKGSKKGPAVRPRDLEKSRMIKLIAGGEMPPEGKGTPVPEDKLKLLKDWIEQGAKFDGENRQKKAALTSYASAEEGNGSPPKETGKTGRKRGGSISSLGGGETDPPARNGGK